MRKIRVGGKVRDTPDPGVLEKLYPAHDARERDHDHNTPVVLRDWSRWYGKIKQIKDLPHTLRVLAVQHMREQNYPNDGLAAILESDIDDAFDWGSTPEGSEFWAGLCNLGGEGGGW